MNADVPDDGERGVAAPAVPCASRPPRAPRARDGRLRVGVLADGLAERRVGGRAELANGGVGVYSEQLVRALLELDALDLVLLYPSVRELPLLGDPRIETVRWQGPGWLRWARWIDWGIAGLARRHRLDLVHYPNQFGGGFLGPEVRRVMTLHDLTPLQFPQFHPPRAALGYRLLLRRALAQADAVVVDSDAVRAEVVAVAPAVAPRVTTIPLGVGAHFRPGRRTPDFSRRLGLPDRYVLSVGVLEPRKNHGALVSALARLHAAGERISLVLAGRTGWRWRDPLEAPGLSALRPWVRVIRNVSEDDLVELYGRAAVLAYPSFAEGFGLPLLEAMACGCPVVASTRGSLPEVGGDAAVYAPPEDVEALAAQLLALLRDEGHRRLHVERGRVRAAGFTWRRTAERMLAVYRAIAPDAHRSSPGVA